MPFTRRQIDRILDEGLLPDNAQLGLDIYLAYLQRVQAIGRQLELQGIELQRLVDRMSKQAKSADFDYDQANELLRPVLKHAEAFGIFSAAICDWGNKIHALH